MSYTTGLNSRLPEIKDVLRPYDTVRRMHVASICLYVRDRKAIAESDFRSANSAYTISL